MKEESRFLLLGDKVLDDSLTTSINIFFLIVKTKKP